MKHYIYLLLSLVLVMTACDENEKGLAPGSLYLDVEQDSKIETKAITEVATERLQIDIIDVEGDTIKHYDDYLTEVKGQKILIPAGDYQVKVSSIGNKEAAWEKPFYAGATEVTVNSGELTSAQIVCTIANTKVAVQYADNFAQYFINYETTVSNTSGSLLFTKDEYRAGFFKSEKLVADLKVVNLDGNEFVLQRVFPDVKPQYFYKIKFTLDNPNEETEGGADIGGITIDEKADTIYYGIYIKQEDLFKKTAPVATLSGFTDNMISYVKKEGSNAPANSISIAAANGIKSVRLEVASAQLPDLSMVDLCNLTPDQKSQLNSVNFPTASLKDQTEATLDLTAFAAALNPASDTKKGEHILTLAVLDNLHQESRVTVKYEIRPDVAAYVEEPTTWTTFAVLKGYCAEESAYFKVSTGSTVKDIKVISRDAEGNMQALVTGFAAGNYEYWIASDENTDLTCPKQAFSIVAPTTVPNLGFDKWCTLSGSSPTGNKNYTSPNENSSNVFWESGNLGAASASKTLTYSTDNIAITGSEKAAVLKSQWAGMLGFGAFAAGSVFSGYPTSVTTSGATLQYGRPYQGFPTHFRGYYKYTPGTIDYYGDKTPADGLKKGEKDQCVIHIALSTKQHTVISTTSQVVPYPFDDPSVFAYGTYVSGTTEDTTGETASQEIQNGYAPFKITLNYKTATMPTGDFYILIVASSSRYGEYFTGSTGSEMYIDEFSLDYEYSPEAFGNTSLKNLTPNKY